MKKYLFIMATAALFAACSSDSDPLVENEDEPQVAINFDQFVGNQTRAAIADKAALATEGGFVVYGYKADKPASGTPAWTSGTQTIFNAENVKSSDSGTTWTYDNLRFWDKQSYYNFFAVAPYSPASGTYTIDGAANGYFTIDGAKSNKSTDSDDFLVARGGKKNVDGNYTGTHAKVEFDFHHVMAKVDFKLKSTLSTGKVTVTRLEMTGWNNGQGKFVQNQAATPTTLECTEWTIATADDGDKILVGTGAGQETVELTCANPSTDVKAVTDWYIMVPQAIAANTLKFTIDYTYTKGDYTETFKDQEATLAAAQTWGTDSHTTYTLNIAPGAIEFDVTSICGFCVNGGDNGVTVQ